MELAPNTMYMIALAAGVLIVLALAMWALGRRKAPPAHHADGHGLLTHEEREGSLRRELESLRETNRLLTERFDRFDRLHSDERDDLVRIRESSEARLQRIDMLERQNKELQEQIFELRETQKVLLQRDDRHERTVQDIQTEIARTRSLGNGQHA